MATIKSIHNITIRASIDSEGLIEVSVDEFKGCFASGETLEEAMQNTAEAIYLWLDSQKDNDPSFFWGDIVSYEENDQVEIVN